MAAGSVVAFAISINLKQASGTFESFAPLLYPGVAPLLLLLTKAYSSAGSSDSKMSNLGLSDSETASRCSTLPEL